ncbi:Transcriptional regulatory protein LiaR [Anaerolineae bacterium]|nr:Transcriptional regulatory protein LiaR [Anaerolineae bacterium]
MNEQIRVLIVDDHPMVRRGLCSLLASFKDIEVVGEAEDAVTALRAAASLCPEVILLDIQMQGPDGVAVASQLHKQAPGAKVIMLTAYDNDEYVEGALRAGAYGYLSKSDPASIVVGAIRQVHKGKHMLSPHLLNRVLEQFQELAKVKVKYQSGLSDDELRVLALIAEGATNEKIARDMYWAQRTVRRKVDEIILKMGVKNRAQAVAEAVKKGLI